MRESSQKSNAGGPALFTPETHPLAPFHPAESAPSPEQHVSRGVWTFTDAQFRPQFAKPWDTRPELRSTYGLVKFHPLPNVAALVALLALLKTLPDTCIMRGQFAGSGADTEVWPEGDEFGRAGKPKRRPGLARKSGEYWHDEANCLFRMDVDGHPVCDALTDLQAAWEPVLDLLPEPLSCAALVVSPSSKAGAPAHLVSDPHALRGHVLALLEEPLTLAEQATWAEAIRASVPQVDTGIYTPAGLLRTAAPDTAGYPDPLAGRRGPFVSWGTAERAALPASPPGVVAAPPRPAAAREEADPAVQALEEAGFVRGDAGPGKLNIRCPFEHGEGTETRTQYMKAHHDGRTRGAFKCLHSSCQDRPSDEFRTELWTRHGVNLTGVRFGLQPTPHLGAANEPTMAGAARYQPLDLAGLLARFGHQRYALEGVYPALGVGALAGGSGSGKTFLALDLLCAIADGRDWYGLRTSTAPCRLLALEGEAGLASRITAWQTHHGRQLPDAVRVVLGPFNFATDADVVDFAASLPLGGVVAIDTLAQGAAGLEENSATDMGLVVSAAKRISEATGGLVLLVHHFGKDQAKGMRGSSSLYAAMDGVIEMHRDGETDKRHWRIGKSKDGRDGGKYGFRLADVDIGVDDEGRRLPGCVAVPDQAALVAATPAPKPQGVNQSSVHLAVTDLLHREGAFDHANPSDPRKRVPFDAAVEAGAGALDLAKYPTAAKRRGVAKEAIARMVDCGLYVVADGALRLSTFAGVG